MKTIASILPPPTRFESVPPDEHLYIEKLVDLLKGKVLEMYPPGKTLRDAHPKQHGTVSAQFIVEPDLPPELRVGVFKKPATYNAFVRFSNANPAVSADIRRDVRGMAIKLLGVRGRKLAESEPGAPTHDFVLISYDVFLTKGVREMYEFTNAYESGVLNVLWYWFNPLKPHLRVFWNFLVPFRHAASPLDLRYWSMTPYLFGERAVKYSAKPWPHAPSTIPRPPQDNYLSDALQRHLLREPMSFDFMVQLQTDPRRMPIEDAGKRWSEELSPFIKVATIVIPPQEFQTAPKMEFGDNLSYSPWRALPEHRPLGGINRCRKVAYWAISDLRHARNAVAQQEPTERDWKLFNKNNIPLPIADATARPLTPLVPSRRPFSKLQRWVKLYSYITILAAVYGVAYAHTPALVGARWSVCGTADMLWCVLAIHLFEIPMVTINVIIAWFGLRRFSQATMQEYISLLGVVITFNMVFFAFETSLLLEGLRQSYPFWELFAFLSIALMLLGGSVLTILLKQVLIRAVAHRDSHAREGQA